MVLPDLSEELLAPAPKIRSCFMAGGWRPPSFFNGQQDNDRTHRGVSVNLVVSGHGGEQGWGQSRVGGAVEGV